MARIIMSGPQNMTLDGVVEDPDGAEGSDHGDWFRRAGRVDLELWNLVALREAVDAEAWLLGRRSYEFFGSRWRDRSGPLADRLRVLPKYVVSSTLTDPDWDNTTVLRGDVVDEITRLKTEIEGNIIVPASATLARSLIQQNLVDELRVVVFPVVLGRGRRLFDGCDGETRLRLVESALIGRGLVHLRYEFDHDVQGR